MADEMKGFDCAPSSFQIEDQPALYLHIAKSLKQIEKAWRGAGRGRQSHRTKWEGNVIPVSSPIAGIRSVRRMLLAGAVVCSPVAAYAQDQTVVPAGSGIEDIVVTAQKREQNLQDVPISITALTASALQANRIVDVRDLNAVAPNLTVRIASGGVGLPSYSMRGIATQGAAPGTDKGISLYLDGVYLQNVIGSIFQLADVERIEVLKGPQGTLFGRNSTGGAISITTRNPTGKFGVRQQLTYGNFDQLMSRTRLDLPKIGPISASFSYVHSERRGDTRNLGAGTQWDYGPATGGREGIRTSPKYLGNENIESFGAALKFDLLDDLDLIYKFDYSQNHYTPEAQGLAAEQLSILGPLAGFYLNAPDPSVLTQITGKRPKAVNNAFTTPGFISNMGHNLTASYRFSDTVSVKNILAFRKSRASATYQLDGSGGLVTTFPLGPGLPAGTPFVFLGTAAASHEKQWSNEFQLNVNTEWFALTAGYIHFHDAIRSGGFEGGPNVVLFSPVPGFVIPGSGRQSDIRVDSDAVFVQPEFHLTDRLDIVLGSRLTIDRKKGTDRSAFTTLGDIPVDYRHSQPTWLAGANYRPSRDLMVYAKYSTGYISGGSLSTRDFAPERSVSYEAGLKADLFDRRFRSNLALFSVKYRGLQFTTPGSNVGIPEASQVVLNGANGKAKGFEWENTLQPIDGLTLQANVGYSDFKYTYVNPIFGNLTITMPINRPKWTANGSIEYRTGEMLAGGHLVMRGDVNYRSRTYLSNSLMSQDPALLRSFRTNHSWIVNGRIALADLALAGSKAEVALWGRNLANNRQFANISGLNFFWPGSYERARTYGVDMTFEF